MTKALLKVFSFNVVAKVLLGASGILLIRYMQQAEYAKYTLALSLGTLVTQTLAYSFNSIYIVGYDSLGLEENSNSFLGFQLLCVVLLAAISFPLASWGVIYWVTLVLIISTIVSEYSKTYFQRRREFSQFAMVEFLRAAIFLISLVVLIFLAHQQVLAWQGLALQALCFLAVFFALSGVRLNGDLFNLKKAIRISSKIWNGKYRFLFAYFCVLSVFSQLDVLMLKAISNSQELATYGAAFRYYTLLSLALASVHAVLLPTIQQLKSSQQLDQLLTTHFKTVVVFGLATLAGAWLSRWIIPLLDMGKYPESITVFRILAVSAILSFALSPHVNLLMRFEDFRFLTILIGVTLVLNLGLNFPLVRSRGATGAAIATLLAYLFLNGSIFLRARRYRDKLDGPALPEDELAALTIETEPFN